MEKLLANSFNKLINTSGRLDKEKLIEDYVENIPMFIETISFLCDTNIVTNLASKKN